MASEEINLFGSGIECRGRNGWFNASRLSIQEYQDANHVQKVYVSIASKQQYRDAAPIMIEGTKGAVIHALEDVVRVLKGVRRDG